MSKSNRVGSRKGHKPKGGDKRRGKVQRDRATKVGTAAVGDARAPARGTGVSHSQAVPGRVQ